LDKEESSLLSGEENENKIIGMVDSTYQMMTAMVNQ